jgi:cytochrome c553
MMAIMAISANATVRGAIAAVCLTVLATATPERSVAQPAPVAGSQSIPPASSTVTGGGVTLSSVNVKLPAGENLFPGGRRADAINNDCLLCHSAGMVLDQAKLSRAQWRDEIEKMRTAYKAPFAAEDIPAILDYLADLNSVASQGAARQPDAKQGAAIAAQGTAAGAAPCAECHAFDGVSDASGAFPRLAGQPAYYLAQQLHDFASDVRANAIMSPIAKALSPDEIADVTSYYAGVTAPLLPLKASNPALVKRGEELAKAGGPERMHCDNCHGPGGSGAPPTVPYLAGQYASYITSTLQMWQNGFRKNSPDTMALIAKKLDHQDILAVAAYYQQMTSSVGSAPK